MTSPSSFNGSWMIRALCIFLKHVAGSYRNVWLCAQYYSTATLISVKGLCYRFNMEGQHHWIYKHNKYAFWIWFWAVFEANTRSVSLLLKPKIIVNFTGFKSESTHRIEEVPLFCTASSEQGPEGLEDFGPASHPHRHPAVPHQHRAPHLLTEEVILTQSPQWHCREGLRGLELCDKVPALRKALSCVCVSGRLESSSTGSS